MSADDSSYSILCVGLDETSEQSVRSVCSGCQYTVISNAEDFEKHFESWVDGMFNGIFAGPNAGISGVELAQVLQNQCPETYSAYVAHQPENWEPRLLIKNGFKQCFQLPMDLPLLKEAVLTKVMVGPKAKRVFKGVRIFDIGVGDQLEFETYAYLPLNKKHVKLSAKGEGISEKKLGKLQSNNVGQVYVDSREMTVFYNYAASKLRKLGQDASLSDTEREAKLKEAVHTIFQDIFDSSIKGDFEQGKAMISQVEGIISNYITKGGTSNWYKRLLATLGDGAKDTYSHSSAVSTYAALFAIGIGHPAPEDLAMAGLFHDIGLSELPVELHGKPDWEIPAEQKELYYSHPERSCNRVKQKRIVLPPAVEKAIMQHHEKFNGRGGPKQLPAARLSDEAMILSFADQFDYWTRIEEGKKRYTPLQAFEEIKRSGSINPDILAKIKGLLQKQAGEQ